jgi:hypothetical protein
MVLEKAGHGMNRLFKFDEQHPTAYAIALEKARAAEVVTGEGAA